MTTKSDNQQLKEKNISSEQFDLQIQRFKDGFPYLHLLRPATVNDGILVLNDSEIESYSKLFKNELKTELTVSKFVPASGAASRMFKDLYQYLDDAVAIKQLPEDHPVVRFIELLPRFAFFSELELQLKAYNLNNIHVRKSKAKEIIAKTVEAEGLNYGQLPKGLIHFHKYNDKMRTAMEEHLVETSKYAINKDGLINVHFTVSPEHYDLFQKLLYEKGPSLENKYETGLNVSFSFQKPHTDTIAVSLDNEPFRDENGRLVFRPGGHGALLENLNDQDTQLIFIKNIDNVVPEHLLEETIIYKKALAGLTLELRNSIFEFLRQLDSSPARIITEQIINFIKSRLFIELPRSFKALSHPDRIDFLKMFLNRPIRVCGMVKNEGEPGGGPFWIKDATGGESLQILEASQINMDDSETAAILKASTHFNPVDIICYTQDYKGKKFDLTKFTDPETGFISEKTYNGRELKALELPGLWNGAMANWITLFVEIPIETFNPVKTVNDLLRPQHQPKTK